MKNYVIKSILIFTLIYAFVIAVILFMFTWYQNSYEKDCAYNLGNQQHEVYRES